jgi:hypothetical protein
MRPGIVQFDTRSGFDVGRNKSTVHPLPTASALPVPLVNRT